MLNLEKQIYNQIEKANKILILFPNTKDEDPLAASLAFLLFIEKLGKKADVVEIQDNDNLNNSDKKLSFLPKYSKITNKLNNLRDFIVSLNIKDSKINKIKYSINDNHLNFIISPDSGNLSTNDLSLKTDSFKYDLIINLAIPDLNFLGKIHENNAEFFYKTAIINIDNTAGNEEYGQINYMGLNFMSISEIAYFLINNYKKPLLDKDIATCILAGIIKKTNNFKVKNLNPKTLLASSELISLGAKREEIIKNLFYSKDISSLKLWGEILKNLKSENDGKLVWSKIEQEYLNDFPLNKELLEVIVDELISSLPEAKAFYTLVDRDKEVEIYAFSLNSVNVFKVLEKYEAKGDRYFVKVILNKGSDKVEDLLSHLKKSFL